LIQVSASTDVCGNISGRSTFEGVSTLPGAHGISPKGSGHVVADQSEVAAFLARPETHGGAPVERIDTHAAMVFLTGDLAYKVKRAVAYPYMDFSTLSRRRAACLREVEINRRTAPKVYLDARPILRRADGRLSLDGTGEAVEWTVVMRRFEQAGLFDRLAQAGRLTPTLLLRLADEVARFHEAAEPILERAGELGWVIDENAGEFVERPELFAPDRAERLTAAARAALERVAGLLEDRRARGLVRRCHGDLHLRNVCLIDGRPTLFDAIEFNDAIACIDVLYDFAFLLMDLDHRGLRPAANLVFNRYLQRSGDLEALAALPLFLSLRAAVRAKVSASAALSQDDEAARRCLEDEAGAYFAAAAAYLAPPPARLVVVGGFSGSGKSTLARALAPALGPAPGALHLRSDVLRKALHGVDELTELPQEAYRPAVSERVYDELLARARRALAAGHAVALDAVYSKPQGRREVETLARRSGVAFTGLWLEAPREVLRARAAARRADASDATPGVVDRQLAEDPGTITWHRLEAGGTPEEVVADAQRILGCGPR
jgi:aminoglycoside phosphotransferase family enzyme/adenylate kinase family enzyme